MNPNRLNFAVCGLGYYAENWIAPAIAQSAYSSVKAIITGSPAKVSKWQKQYNIKDSNVYSYENLDAIAQNPEIDCVYIVTPTGLHCEQTIRCLAAGKHVIVEKPMAPNASDCIRMIEASVKANKSLQIGYRLHWDPFHLSIMNAMRKRNYGDWSIMRSGFSYDQASIAVDNDWRMSRAMNIEGAIYDIGVYVIQSAFYAANESPISVQAKSHTSRKALFKEFPEHWEWTFRWSNGQTSHHSSSYGLEENTLTIETEKGSLGILSAYGYDGQKGFSPDGKMNYTHLFQQKHQLEGQCRAILNLEKSRTPPEMGLRDIQVINAIVDSAHSKKELLLTEHKL